VIPVILHIPHASTVLPDECRADFTVRGEALERHVAVSTDHFTDALFALAGPDVATVAFPISRLAVDPERFDDDAREPMAARGLGVLYERGHDGTRIRQPMAAARRAWYLDRWYRPHHAALAHAVEEAIARAGCVLIFDCHSFPDAPLAVDLDQSTPRPDGCLGTSGVHTPPWLVDAGLRFAAQQGWSLGVDRPYSGAIVPLPHFGRDARVLSVMIEINRRRYMAIEGATVVKTNGFAATQRFVQGLMAAMRAAASANPPPSTRLP
jgi:N-formylglutamate deformylase